MTRGRTLALAAFCVGCAPELEDQPYLIERPSLIAVIAEPPEVAPGAEVMLTPIVAAPGRARAVSAYEFCADAPAPADPRPVAEACLEGTGSALEIDGATAHGRVPPAACARFGPDPIGSDFRPRDADATGGFYQPIVIHSFGQPQVAALRIICPLPDVPLELSRAYQASYVVNHNPESARLERKSTDGWEPLTAARAGESLEIRVAWDQAAREPYVWLPPDGTALESRVEALRVAWFITAGTLAEAQTGRAEDDPQNDSPNVLTAPDHATTLRIWAVLQDSRGGTGVVEQTIAVEAP